MKVSGTRDAEITVNAEILHKAKGAASLPDCIDDCKLWLRMIQKDYSIPSSKIALFASKINYDKIVDYKLWDVDPDDLEELKDEPRGDLEFGFPGVEEDLLAI